MKYRYQRRASFYLLAVKFGLLAFVLSRTPPAAAAGDQSVDVGNLEQLTTQVLARGESLESRVRASETRQTLLRETMAIDPRAAYEFVLTSQLRSSLPAEIQENIENDDTELTGIFWVLAGTRRDGSLFTEHRLQTEDGQYRPLFLASDRMNLPSSGSRVGFKHIYHVADALLSDATQLLVLAPPVQVEIPTTAAPRMTPLLGIAVKFLDNVTQYPFTVAQLAQGLGETNRFFLENSYNQAGIAATAVGIYQVPFRSTDRCSTIINGVGPAANAAAAAAGVNVSQYSRFYYIFPYLADCGWAGLSLLGGNVSWGNAAHDQTVVSHELGHQFGLEHSHARQCAASGPLDEPCTTSEYGDRADTMGITWGHFNAFQKERLGWFNGAGAPTLQTVTQSGTFRLENYETLSTNLKALKIFKRAAAGSNVPASWLYLECRSAAGFDRNIGYFGDYTSGPIVHLAELSNPTSVSLLNMRSSDLTWRAPALYSQVPSQTTFTDRTAANGGVVITALSRDATGCTVNVALGSFPYCVRANPLLTVFPQYTLRTGAGGTANFGVFLQNNDSPLCGTSTFNLTTAPPAGISGTITPPTLSLAPNGSAYSILRTSVATSAAPGLYSVPVTAVNSGFPGYASTGAGSIGVLKPCTGAPATVTVTPSTQSGAAGSTLTYAVSVKNNNSTGCPSFAFTLSTSNAVGLIASVAPTVLVIPNSVTASATLSMTASASASGDIGFTVYATMKTVTPIVGSAQGVFRVSASP